VPDPVPDVVTVPGRRVSVQVPLDGSPLSTTLPVAIVHVGGVIAPANGAEGVAGWTGITTFDDGNERHPSELVTVQV
jgi:hypothetical protein